MNDLIYRVCADVLINAVQIPTSAAQLPPPAELRQRFLGDIERMVTRGRRYGISDKDLAEARYAVVAFIDEQVLHSEWSGRSEWMGNPLQLELYQENTAGENFFVRLRTLLQRGDRPVAIEIYYLCLALGFSGAYGQSGDMASVEKFARAARQQLKRTLPSADKISPHAKPRGLVQAARLAWAPLLATIGGTLALIGIVLIAINWSLSSQLKAAQVEMAGSATPAAAQPTSVTQLP